jgi:hypothetical protein
MKQLVNLQQWILLSEHEAKKHLHEHSPEPAELRSALSAATSILANAKRTLRSGDLALGKELLAEAAGLILGAAAQHLDCPSLGYIPAGIAAQAERDRRN